MASSDDEVEDLQEFVSDYQFEDDNQEPISFAVLPIRWSVNDSANGEIKQIFLRGTTDDGLQKIYKPVRAWSFDLSGMKPDISVFSKDNKWIKLQKAKKSYEYIIRTILITVNCLHIVRRNLDLSGKSLWDQLSKIFSLYEVRPSENDLIDHIPLIEEALKKDESLAKSQFLMTFLKEKPQKKKVIDEDALTKGKSGFIVDDDDDRCMDNGDMEDDSDDEEQLFDSVCAICDNGGELLCCEGNCFRSFHATAEAAYEAESECASLGLSKSEVEAMQNFRCKNCQYNQHQCFCCGQLGSSDLNSGAEVFRCVNATCGHFYHPKCVAKLLHRDNAAAAEELERKIAAGEKFACPMHKCIVCGKGEDKTDPELQFAACRRCPKSYHKKCLPRKIAFEDNEDEGIIQRAWRDLLPNRILIYCLKHEIDDDIGTPVRNHIKFPDFEDKKFKRPSAMLSSREKFAAAEDRLLIRGTMEERIASKSVDQTKKSSLSFQEVPSDKKSDAKPSRPTLKKLRGIDASRKSFSVKKPLLTKVGKPEDTEERRSSLGERLFAHYSQQSDDKKAKKPDKPVNDVESTKKSIPAMQKLTSAVPHLDRESERRMVALVEEAASSVSLEDIFQKQNELASTHALSQKTLMDRTITRGKVEGSIEAVRTAVKKLDEGCTIEDAKAVCEPNVLNQIVKWKNKLRVYLAPFLYGMRYTSFGRHFTKVDKLKEIVDKIHWYVEEGDMLVDFCCGANDFSWLMKEKLEQTGRKCFFRNYDLFRPKNDFGFEKRDWMTVRPSELPSGSQLIMGLNPPFGVKSSLANKFINKALEFKPKLIILIVPPETERLDKKKPPYDLLWEDDEKLSGRSFYLPGSVDVNDKQIEDWNVVTPILYLWSRKDWTAKHKGIAEKHGHLSEKHTQLQRKLDSPKEIRVPDPSIEGHDEDGYVPMEIDEDPPQNETPKESKDMHMVEIEDHKGPAAGDDNTIGRHGHEIDESERQSKKREQAKENPERERVEISPGEDHKRQRHSPQLSYQGRPWYSPSHTRQVRSPVEGFLSRNEMSAAQEIRNADFQHRPSFSASSLQHGTGYDGMSGYEMTSSGPLSNYVGEVTRKYSFEPEDGYSTGGQRWALGANEPDYGLRSPNEWPTGYTRVTENFPYRPYPSDVNPSYRPLSSALDGRMSVSAMDRYAPRLDELNHSRIGNMGSEFHVAGRSGIYNPQVPRPGMGGVPMGFAPGPHSFSGQSSSGWIRD
ncbi:hypothetical protein Ancab_004506 [Ancistrocladus abbreviatus]